MYVVVEYLVRIRVHVLPSAGGFVSGARHQSHVPEPRLQEVLDFVGELEAGNDVSRVVLVRADLAVRAGHAPQEILLAVVITGGVVSDATDLGKHFFAGFRLVEHCPVSVKLEKISPVEHSQCHVFKIT